MQTVRALALICATAPAVAAAASLVGQHRSLRASEDGVVVPMKVERQLLICNAYPSESPVLVRRNGREDIASAKNALGFQECRYVPAKVQTRDRLEFAMRDMEITGTFEVGSLPTADSLLLLVLEKRPESMQVGFQSFAFPTSSDAKAAQLAVINAFSGNASAPHLKMEDHIASKEKQAKKEQVVAKRVEQLNFNRVYSVEQGGYDVSITDVHRSGVSELDLEKTTRRNLQLTHSSNYVILRTGGGFYKESLVVFPNSPIPSRSAQLKMFGALLACVWTLTSQFC